MKHEDVIAAVEKVAKIEVSEDTLLVDHLPNFNSVGLVEILTNLPVEFSSIPIENLALEDLETVGTFSKWVLANV